MFRFIAIIHDAADHDATEAARHMASRLRDVSGSWTQIANMRGLSVFETRAGSISTRSYVLPENAGIVLGRVFQGSIDTEHAVETPYFDTQTTKRMIATEGRTLVEMFWGYYVAIIRNAVACSFSVVRDCSGKLPCYRVRHGNVNIVLSDVEDAECLGLGPVTIDWQQVASFLLFDDLRVRQTALRNVIEIMPGESFTVGSGVERQSVLWDPMHISSSDVIDDYNQACQALKRATQQCVDAWATVHERILLNLSGGFDSAVVLGCLSRTPANPSLICLNRYTPDPSEDERRYARLAAERAGVKLIECEWSAGGIQLDERLLQAPRLAKPSLDVIALADATFRSDLAQSLSIDAVWTGQGGDHLFLQRRTNLVAADYVYHHGLGLHLLGAISDAARLAEESYWSVLRSITKTLFDREQWLPTNAQPSSATFVRRESLPEETAACICHPWFSFERHVSPGKQMQIRDLADVVNQWSISSRMEIAEEHHPLVSQPLIETCLRIPTYLLLRGGRHRALARAAFADDVPAEILRRESKGSTKKYTTSVIRNSMPFIRDLLLDGLLVREGLIARNDLEPYLAGNKPLHSSQFYPLLACIAAELWSRTWTRSPLRAAA